MPNIVENAVANMVVGTAAGLKFMFCKALNDFFKARYNLRRALLSAKSSEHHHRLLSENILSVNLFCMHSVAVVRDALAGRGRSSLDVLAVVKPKFKPHSARRGFVPGGRRGQGSRSFGRWSRGTFRGRGFTQPSPQVAPQEGGWRGQAAVPGADRSRSRFRSRSPHRFCGGIATTKSARGSSSS